MINHIKPLLLLLFLIFSISSAQAVIGGKKETDSFGLRQSVVKLQFNLSDGRECSGVVIHKRVVISAAHCIKDKRIKIIKYLDIDFKEGKIISKDFVFHPNFKAENIFRNDLVLHHLIKELPSSMIPVRLPHSPPKLREKTTMAGYGRRTMIVSDTYGQLFSIPLVIDEIDIKNKELNIGHLSAFWGYSGKGPCYGDSGAPILRRGAYKNELLGILSNGYNMRSKSGCGQWDNVADIYAHRHWIREQVKKWGYDI